MFDITFDMRSECHECASEKSGTLKVTLVDTGESTMTGGRLKKFINIFLTINHFALLTVMDWLM